MTINIKSAYEQLLREERVINGLEFIKSHSGQTLLDQIELTEIPSPSFQEEERGNFFLDKFREFGLIGVSKDSVGNVFGLRKGFGDGPTLVVSAHLDTVFPAGTDITVTEKEGKYYGPGISDDGRGLTAVLTLIKTLNEMNIQTLGNILFVATACEEGLGDLRGVKNLFNTRNDLDGFISIEPGSPAQITYLATGSLRYQVTYRGPGGHSFGDFGIPSAVHALGRAISMISSIKTPEFPKTTYNIGTINGGTTVNTIAAEASMVIDLRSTDQGELIKLNREVVSFIQTAAEIESKRGTNGAISVDVELVGDRPAGSQEKNSVIVHTAVAATEVLGFEPTLNGPSSTDSNVPISLGIPAVTLGGGGAFGGIHTLGEWFDPTDSHYGIQQVFLTVLGLVGVEGGTNPLLSRNI
jgi:tripeptide aminopeptidase